MDLGKIPALVVGLIISILIVSAVAIPIIEDSTKYVNSVENNTVQKYSMIESTGTHTISYVSPGVFNIDGEEKTITTDDNKIFYPFFVSDTIGILPRPTGAFIFGSGLESSPITMDQTTDVLSFSNGTWTLNYHGTNTYTGSYSWLIIPDDKGDYGMFRFSTSSIHIDNSADFIVLNENSSYAESATTNYGATILRGSVNTGLTGKVWATMNGVKTDITDDVTIKINLNGDKGEISSHLASITQKWGDSAEKALVTVIAPITYHVISENDNSIISLIHILPVLLIVSLLMAIVGTVFVRTQ